MSTARPRAPRRSRSSLHLLGASLMVLVGAFLPWVYTGAGTVLGIRGAGLWTMYAAILGLAGSMIRARGWAAGHAAVLAVVAVALPVWQLLHLFSKVGFAGWMPGAGLVLTLGGGAVAGVAAVRLYRESRGAESA